ncbi:condensation domain-containing protein [Nonomuraea typhae]|uniref:condensation domain-containing protein n=1 Tax=Nonomuraea typhae TaxID=2603600 RepID=UPI0012F7231C|nr:condensation domain-containing protein [Nonomuraea typhae]
MHFDGLPDRQGALTMGQANMARCVRRDPPEHMNFLMIKRVPRRIGLDRIADATLALLSRHEGLRTTFTGDLQHVHGKGALEIVVVPGSGGPPMRAAEEAGARLRAPRFDLEGEFPLRMAVILAGDEPRLAVFVLPHTVVDAISLAHLLREWETLLHGRPLPGPEPTQPIELAAGERTPAAVRRAEAALEHWRSGLARSPQTMFPVAFDTEHAMVPRLRVRSAAVMPGLERAAARTGASPSMIVMAALGTLAGHRTAQPTCLLASLSSNRSHPRLRTHIGPLAQDALIVTDLAAATFDELIARFRVAALAGYQRSRFDSEALWEAIHAMDAERGTRYARDCVFNDMSAQVPPDDDEDPAGDPELTWLPEAALPANLSLWINRLDTVLDLTLWVNPAALPRHEAEVFGAGLVRLLTAAGERVVDVAEIEAVTGVTAMPYGPDWVRSGQSWVRPEAVRRLVEAAVPGSRASVTLDRDGAFTCHLSTGAGLTQGQVHRACLDLLAHHPDAVAPRRYVVGPQA